MLQKINTCFQMTIVVQGLPSGLYSGFAIRFFSIMIRQ